MDSGFYLAAVGALVTKSKIDSINNNIANSSTDGFKRGTISFASSLSRVSENGRKINFPHISKETVDMSQGVVKGTGSPLDIALSGKGFFKIELNGKYYLTRAGSLSVDSNNFLRGEAGGFILDSSSAKIQLPKAGAVSISSKGIVSLDNESVSTLGIVNVKDKTSLVRVAGALLAAPKSQQSQAKTFQIMQGSLEGSNVNSVIEMSNMMSINRHYQSLMAVVKIYDKQAALVNNRLGTTR